MITYPDYTYFDQKVKHIAKFIFLIYNKILLHVRSYYEY